MNPIVYVTLAFAPIIAGIMIFYFSKKNDRNFTSLLLKSYFLGMLGIVVVIIAQYISSLLGLNDLRTLKRIIFYSFVTVGFGSELGIYIILRYFINPKEPVDKPIYGITFAVMVALGFCTVQILYFILDPMNISSLFPQTLYTFVFVPANIMFAIIMGFYVGMAKFIRTRFVYNMTGLFAAAFFAGIFNFCLLTKDFKLLSLFAFGSMVIVFVLGIKAASTKAEKFD